VKSIISPPPGTPRNSAYSKLFSTVMYAKMIGVGCRRLIGGWEADAVPSLGSAVGAPTDPREVRILQECVTQATGEINAPRSQERSLLSAAKTKAIASRATLLFNTKVTHHPTRHP
jgi:hypothetical protein